VHYQDTVSHPAKTRNVDGAMSIHTVQVVIHLANRSSMLRLSIKKNSEESKEGE
jgi:hypothetical protein